MARGCPAAWWLPTRSQPKAAKAGHTAMAAESLDVEAIRVVLGREVEMEAAEAIKRRTISPLRAGKHSRISLLR